MKNFSKNLVEELKYLDKDLDIELVDDDNIDIVHHANKRWLFRLKKENSKYKVIYFSRLMPKLELKILYLIQTYYNILSNYDKVYNELKTNIKQDNELNNKETINHPSRYQTKSGKQLLDLLKEDLLSDTEYIGFLKGNFYKYIYRYQCKNGEEDLEKAQFYLKELKRYEYKD